MLLLRLLLGAAVVLSVLAHGEYKCGHGFINPNERYCCNDIPQPHPGGTPECCLGEAYNSDSHRCCGGTVTVIPPGAKAVNCCNKQAYDPNKETCDETGRLKPWKSESCQRHDTHHFMCCGTQLFKRVPHVKGCCGDYAYNTKTHKCCVHRVRDDHEHVELRVSSVPTGWGYVGCCGLDIYDSDSQICCHGNIHMRTKGVTECCGTNVMDVTREICCNGKPNVRNYMHTACCGEEAYNTDSHICCKESIHKKMTGVEDISVCCMEKLMNGKHQMCCHGNIQPKLDLNYDCCGVLSYDTAHSMCCHDTIQKRHPTLTCCGTQTVDLEKNQCCDQGHRVPCHCPKK